MKMLKLNGGYGVRVNQQLHFPLMSMYFLPLPTCWYHANVTPTLTLSLGRKVDMERKAESRKYVAESEKWSRWFTRTRGYAAWCRGPIHP